MGKDDTKTLSEIKEQIMGYVLSGASVTVLSYEEVVDLTIRILRDNGKIVD